MMKIVLLFSCRILVDLLRLNVAPAAIQRMLKSMADQQQTRRSSGAESHIPPASTIPPPSSSLPTSTRGRYQPATRNRSSPRWKMVICLVIYIIYMNFCFHLECTLKVTPNNLYWSKRKPQFHFGINTFKYFSQPVWLEVLY